MLYMILNRKQWIYNTYIAGGGCNVILSLLETNLRGNIIDNLK